MSGHPEKGDQKRESKFYAAGTCKWALQLP